MNQADNTTVIIDTGCANLSSVRYAFERICSDVIVTDDQERIKSAARVVLPGVGTAGAAMAALKEKRLAELIQGLTQPVLGVCLGMQMMTQISKEHGGREVDCECLGLIPTDVEELDSKGQPLPHMGWNQITPSSHPLFEGIAAGSYLYFVHSFRVPLSEYTIASCEYGETFSAAIAKDNFMGVQFHPEKSAAIGSKILSNFLALDETSLTAATQETK